MKKQMSQVGMGMILTLLMLGFSFKGIYGKVPVNFKRFPEMLRRVMSSTYTETEINLRNQINSLFVKRVGNGNTALIMLIAHDEAVTRAVQELLESKQTPLVFSVSTLPFARANFDPINLQFEQDEHLWQANSKTLNEVMFPLSKDGRFGGDLKDDDIHQGVVLLPEWFDLTRPITIRYLNNERLFTFLEN